MTSYFIKLLRLYHAVSTAFWQSIPGIVQSRCRYFPTCSEYTEHAVRRYGVARGVYMGLIRVGGCNPFTKQTTIKNKHVQ